MRGAVGVVPDPGHVFAHTHGVSGWGAHQQDVASGQGLRSSTRTGASVHRAGAVVAMIAPSGRSGVGWAA